MYMVTEQQTLRFELRTRSDPLPSQQIPLYDEHTGRPNENFVSVYTVLHNRAVLIDDVYAESRFDLTGTRAFDRWAHAAGDRPASTTFLGLGALVSALWYGPSAPVPEPAWLRDLSLMVGVVGLAVGTATLAVTLRALEGRWSASAVFPGFNLIAVSSLVAQRLTMPVGRRLLTLVLAIGLFAWRLRAVPEFALLPGLAVLDTITAVELARRDALETLGRRRP